MANQERQPLSLLQRTISRKNLLKGAAVAAIGA